MKTIIRVSFVVVLLCLFALPVQAQLEKHEALASKLVNQCANIQENDNVIITGSIRDADLMGEISLQIQKVGAFPLVVLGNQLATRRSYDVVPEKYDSQKNEFGEKLINILDAQIAISTMESLDLFKDVPVERMQKRAEAGKDNTELMQNRNIRAVSLGNGLYPTEALAKQFGITKKELANEFWGGVNTDYNNLNQVGKSIKTVLDGGKKLHITSEMGTDIKMAIKSRPVIISDGMISDKEAEDGFPACLVWLPAGEVYLSPVPGTANGKIVVDNFFYQGETIEKLTLEFESGKLISMTAKSNLDSYKETYDKADEGKDAFAFVDIGINPDVKIIPGSQMEAFMIAGMITVGHGNNTWAGGKNNSTFGTAYYLTEATLKVDGKVVVKKGMLK
ncbi:aminopeptidase [Candidatus Neomarinimicrobiota bacterium]